MRVMSECKFGEWLKSKINEDDLYLTILANDLGINRQTIYNHVRGLVTPSRHALKVYAEYFGEDYWYLYELSRK